MIRYRNFPNILSWSRMLRASHGTIYDWYKDIIDNFSRQSAMLHIYLQTFLTSCQGGEEAPHVVVAVHLVGRHGP